MENWLNRHSSKSKSRSRANIDMKQSGSRTRTNRRQWKTKAEDPAVWRDRTEREEEVKRLIITPQGAEGRKRRWGISATLISARDC